MRETAFASQSLMVIESLKLDPSKVNPKGGAIALGFVSSPSLCSITDTMHSDTHWERQEDD
jgi:acetyl-CoA acetyltransferase